MKKLLLFLAVFLFASQAHAGKIYTFSENMFIPTGSTDCAKVFFVDTNAAFVTVQCDDGGGGGDETRRVKVPLIFPSDAPNSWTANVHYMAPGTCSGGSEDTLRCYAAVGCPGGSCVVTSGGCDFSIVFDAHPDATDLTGGPGDGNTITGSDQTHGARLTYKSPVLASTAVNVAGGADCTGTSCRGLYSLATIELVGSSTDTDFCDIRALEISY